MPQHLLHYLGVNANCQHQGSAAMPQIMKPDAQPSSLAYSTKIVAQCASSLLLVFFHSEMMQIEPIPDLPVQMHTFLFTPCKTFV